MTADSRAVTGLLAAPGRLGPVATPNRIVLSPLTTNYADADGFVTDRMIDYYVARAGADVGLIVVEGAIVSSEGRGTPYQIMVTRDEHVPGLRRLARAVQSESVPVLLQLLHHGRQTTSKLIGTSPVAPSAITDPLYGETPRAMTSEDIRRVVGDFADGAARAVAAGYDGIHVHAAHGYLITSFLSLAANRRTDEYGGSLRNRARLLLDIVTAIRERLGPDRALVVRLSAEEGILGGVTVEETQQVAKWLVEAGIDALDVSAGTRETHYRLSPTAGTAEGINLDLAASVKAVVDVPVVVVGTVRSPQTAEEALRTGAADFVSVGRALIADGEWAAKALSGRNGEIVPCIGCNVCAGRRAQPEIRCPVNPFVGNEGRWVVRGAAPAGAVVIRGSGLPGLEAARVAAERGHRVTVLEPSGLLGGLSALRARTPLQDVLAQAISSYERRLRRAGVDLVLGSAAASDDAWEEGGSRAVACVDPARGYTGPVGAWRVDQVLSNDATEPGRWIVRGDSLIAAETAGFLAERGHEVVLAAAGGRVATDTNATLRHYVLRMLANLGVQLAVGAAADEVLDSDGDHVVGDWRPVVTLTDVGAGGVVNLGDDFNPSVLVGLTEGAAQWAMQA